MSRQSLAAVLGMLAALGCDQAASPPSADTPTPATPSDATQVPRVKGEPAEVLDSQLSSVPEQPPDIPDLWTRKRGLDWPVFLGPSGNSKSAETGIIKKWPATGLKIVWHKPLGDGYGAPAISRGRLFQFDRFGNRARLYCLNAETGVQLWQHEYPTNYRDMLGYNNGPRCSPVIDGERVYAFGVDGRLLCCRVTDGKVLWEIDTQKEFGVVQNFFGVGSTPVVEGDLLLVMIGGSPPESRFVPPMELGLVDPNGTGIVAFDKRTGEVKYKLADELASYASLKLATIGNRRWCFAFCRGGLVGFDPTTGKPDFHYPWRAPIRDSVNASVPVVAGSEVLISETYGPGSTLLKVDPGKHEILWKDEDRSRDKAMQTHWMTPVYLDGYLYGSSGRHESAVLRCIEWRTGKVMWDQPSMSRTSLLYLDGHFLCLGEDGRLWLLKANPAVYDEMAAFDYGDPEMGEKLIGEPGPVLRNPCWAAPIVSHGLLYVRGDGRLLCLELIPQS